MLHATSLRQIYTNFAKQQPVFLKEVKHKLTHQHLTIRFYVVNDFFPKLKDHWIALPVKDLENYPFPVALRIELCSKR
jgi:adenine-specific DNA glycosylase